MIIKVTDNSVSYKGLVGVDGHIYFVCNHDRAYVVRDTAPFPELAVQCPDCWGDDLTDEDAEEILDESTDTY